MEKHVELFAANQRKGDLEGAEEYYFRAANVDPGDGEILSQYAILVWELHHDHERALTYFKLASQAAPNDRFVIFLISLVMIHHFINELHQFH